MQKNISFISKINKTCFYLLLLLLISNCFKVDKNSIRENKSQKTKKSVLNNKVNIQVANLFYYKEAFGNSDDEQANVNYSAIDEGFLNSIFNQNDIESTENNQSCVDSECLDEQDINQTETNNELDTNIGKDSYKFRVYKLNIEVLKERLKIKAREMDICRINERLTITPRLKIITNKKRNYTIDFSYKF